MSMDQARKRADARDREAGKASSNGRHTPPAKTDEEPSLSYEPVPWPEPPAEEAYFGLAGEIVRAIDPETEADPVALLVQLLTYFGSAVGRTAYRPVGARRHHGNLYCVLVGRTAKGRKGTALAWVESLFAQVDPTWLEDCVQTGLSSGEGLIAAVRDEVRKREEDGREVVVQAGAKDKRLLVVEEEFGGTLQLARREGNILWSVLRQGWDGGRLRTMTKTNPLKATDAHFSLIGHVTREDLLKHLSSTEVANGSANRCLWVCVRRSKVLPDGGGEAGLERFYPDLETALQRARLRKCLSRDPEAVALWHRVYRGLSDEAPGMLGAVTNRAEAQVLRLTILYTLLDCSDVIRAEHLLAALALWDYCQRSCAWVFGSSLGDVDADALAGALEAAGDRGMSSSEVSGLFGRHKSAEQIKRVLGLLVENGLARMETANTGGRPVYRWFGTAKKAKKAK